MKLSITQLFAAFLIALPSLAFSAPQVQFSGTTGDDQFVLNMDQLTIEINGETSSFNAGEDIFVRGERRQG